jgi:hypothetical protein
LKKASVRLLVDSAIGEVMVEIADRLVFLLTGRQKSSGAAVMALPLFSFV